MFQCVPLRQSIQCLRLNMIERLLVHWLISAQRKALFKASVWSVEEVTAPLCGGMRKMGSVLCLCLPAASRLHCCHAAAALIMTPTLSELWVDGCADPSVPLLLPDSLRRCCYDSLHSHTAVWAHADGGGEKNFKWFRQIPKISSGNSFWSSRFCEK